MRVLFTAALLFASTTFSFGQVRNGPTGDLGRTEAWPAVFDPLRILQLNLQMDPSDWVTIQHDDTFSIEVPALFWADGESPILVLVRRKSADPLDSGAGFRKVSLKIDINDLVDGQSWRGLRKLSLENGDDQDVVSEGLAWNLHRMASTPEGYGYLAGFASWVRLNINGVYTGVYVSAEQRDKQFLRNRGLWNAGSTWLYKISDIDGLEKEEGSGDSPTVDALCYSPFSRENSDCPTPDDDTLANELPALIDMKGMLTMAAVDAFVGNPDALFSHGKNCYFADFLTDRRLYFPWDLDSVITRTDFDIFFPPQEDYPAILLGVPEFRDLYVQTFTDILDGPLGESSILVFLDSVEPVITPSLEQDPNNQIGGPISDHFDHLRDWIRARIMNVRQQLSSGSP